MTQAEILISLQSHTYSCIRNRRLEASAKTVECISWWERAIRIGMNEYMILPKMNIQRYPVYKLLEQQKGTEGVWYLSVL